MIALLYLLAACSSANPTPTPVPSPTPQPTATPFKMAPTATPAPMATTDLSALPDDIIEGFGIEITSFMDELQAQGQRSSLFIACQQESPGAMPGAHFVSDLTTSLGDDLLGILDRGMGGAEIACMVEKDSSLGGKQITIIYDLLDPGWIATERQLRAELDQSGIPDIIIEGSYVEFDFFPSGSFRIPTLAGMGYPGELQMEMVFLTSDVVVNVSDPNQVCGDPAEGDVPTGTGAVGEVTQALGDDLQTALGVPLTRSCVTWSELGDVTSLDLQFGGDAPPADNPIPALKELLQSYGASDLNSGGNRLRGGAGFSDAGIAGHSVTGTINISGNDSFIGQDAIPVQAFIGVTASLQIRN